MSYSSEINTLAWNNSAFVNYIGIGILSAGSKPCNNLSFGKTSWELAP